MTIARQGSAVAGASIAHSATPSYAVNAASNLVVVAVTNGAPGGTISGITYGGTALTINAYEDTTDSTWVTLGYLLSPPTGANNIAVSGLTGGSMTVLAADYSGVSAADGSFVTNDTTSGASLTTNVALAAANEWVMCAAICGHTSNTFSTTTNLTIEEQDETYLPLGFYDSNTGYGSGTVGFVTTITGGAPRQWVVMQAFSPSGGGTAVTADAGMPLEDGSTQTRDPAAAAEWSAAARRDAAAPAEGSGNIEIDRRLPAESLAGVRRGSAYGGLGAVYGAPLAYWGLRALDDAAAAAGVKAVQLQRASDNATLDIHVLASGRLDVPSAAAFLAGTTGGVSIWYDQSGNAYNMTQATQALQPQFRFAATPDGQPGVVFDGANSTVLRYDTGIPNTVAPLLCASFVEPQGITSSPASYVDSVSGGNQGFQTVSGTDWVAFFYNLNYISVSDNTWHSAQLQLAVGTNAQNFYLDGASNPANNAYVTGTSVLIGGPDCIGANTGGLGLFNAYFTGTISEIGWFPVAASLVQLAAGYDDQLAAWVTGAAAPGGVLLETAATQRADPRAPAEWLASGTTVAGDAITPIEFATRAGADGSGPFESAAGRRSDTPAPAEFAATRRADPGLPAAWLRRQIADPPAAIGGLGGIARDQSAPAESSGAVAVASDALLPLENLRRQQADADAPGESLAALRSDGTTPAETLATQRRDDALWGEFLASALRDAGLPAEWQGGALAIADAALRLEWLAGQRSDPGLGLEFTGGVAVAVLGDSGLPLETGGVVRVEMWGAAEIAAGIVAEAGFPAELLIAAGADGALPAAALLIARLDPPVSAEWLGQALTIAEALVPVEIGHGVVVATRGPNEALADALQIAGGATETTTLLLRDPPVPAELTARLLGTSAPLSAQSQAIVRLAAGGPVEWEAPPMLLVSLSRLLASIGKRRILKE